MRTNMKKQMMESELSKTIYKQANKFQKMPITRTHFQSSPDLLHVSMALCAVSVTSVNDYPPLA